MSEELAAKIAAYIWDKMSDEAKKAVFEGLKEMQKAGYGDKPLTPETIAEFFRDVSSG